MKSVAKARVESLPHRQVVRQGMLKDKEWTRPYDCEPCYNIPTAALRIRLGSRH